MLSRKIALFFVGKKKNFFFALFFRIRILLTSLPCCCCTILLFCIYTLYLWICAVATAMLRGHFGSNLSADMLHQNRRSPGRSINMFDFVLKGANASQLEKDIGSDLFPANEHFFGLVNVSIILYFWIFL